jgi:hypothetical protein
MAAKLAGFAWAFAMTAAVMVGGCQEPEKQKQDVPTVNASAPALQRQIADPTVSVFGLTVRAAQYDETLKLFQPAQDYGVSDRTAPAVDVVLHVSTEKYDFIRLDSAVVESLLDEAGHDLSMGMTHSAKRLFFPSEANVSLDHKHGFIALHFPRPPAASTRQLTMRGSVLARSGGKPQTLTFDNMPFAKGSTFKVMERDYTLDNIWSYDSQPDQINFSFATNGSYDEVRAIRFLSVDGKKVVGSIWRVDRFPRQSTKLLCRVIGERPQAVRIEVDTFDKPIDLAIPFQLSLDVGSLSSGEPVKLVTTATLPPAPVENRIKSISQVIELTLTAPIPEQEGKQWFGDFSSVAAFRRPGLKMQVNVHVPDRKMVRLMSAPGTVLSLTDDTGSSLSASASLAGNADPGTRDLTAISRDGHDALVTVVAASMPSASARELHFKGKIAVLMEDSEKVAEAKAVALMPGTAFNVGDVQLKVTSVQAAGMAGNGMYLTLSAGKPIHGTVSLRDENGKELASTPIPEDPSRRLSETSQVAITLPKAVDTAIVQLRTTSEADAVWVPVEFTVPIGLGSARE